MTDIHVGIILNGATSGLCRNQHLRALMAIIAEGGLPANDGDRIIPKPMLLGRNAESLRLLADASGGLRWTDDFNAALGSKEDTIFFDVASTGLRYANVCRAIEAGKHVYCEKPIATTLPEAMDIVERAEKAGVKNGTVQDKLFLPGFSKLRKLRESGFFGRIFEVRLEFGRWIFDGEHQPAQRPSWNYRKEAGGGLVLDMFPHWRYMIDNIVGEIKAVSCTCRTHVVRRRDEKGRRYEVDVEDSAFAQMELEGGIIASVNSSWCTRVYRDDIIVIQIDGSDGSAVATAHDCVTQPGANTSSPVLSVDKPQPHRFREEWLAVPDNQLRVNSYRAGWEGFLRHVVFDEPFPFTLGEGAKGVQLAELSHHSSLKRRWVDVPPIR
jgi:predicted dehydrogenase